MAYSTKVLVLTVVFLQMFGFWWNCTARGEDDPLAENKAEDDESSKSGERKEFAEQTCYAPSFRESCPVENPCCLYNGKTKICMPPAQEGENCTKDNSAYNTKFCFCKKGLFCVDKTCSSKKPEDYTNEKDLEIYKK